MITAKLSGAGTQTAGTQMFCFDSPLIELFACESAANKLHGVFFKDGHRLEAIQSRPLPQLPHTMEQLLSSRLRCDRKQTLGQVFSSHSFNYTLHDIGIRLFKALGSQSSELLPFKMAEFL